MEPIVNLFEHKSWIKDASRLVIHKSNIVLFSFDFPSILTYLNRRACELNEITTTK